VYTYIDIYTYKNIHMSGAFYLHGCVMYVFIMNVCIYVHAYNYVCSMCVCTFTTESGLISSWPSLFPLFSYTH